MTPSSASDNREEADCGRVHVVDDDPAIRGLVVKILESVGLQAVPHANGAEFLAQLDRDESGCVVLDMVMPETSGLEVLGELRKDHPDLPVIMISGGCDIPNALESLRGGAVDFLEKPFRPAQLIDRVQEALAIGRQSRRQVTWARRVRQRIDRLTPRETELLPLFQQGESVKRIAFDLGLSPKTVQVHRAEILRIMQVPSLVDLANLMHEFGEISQKHGI